MKKDKEDRANYGSSLAILLWAEDALNIPLDNAMCDVAAAAGDLEALEHLRGKGCIWKAATCAAAAAAGHMHVLKHLRSAPIVLASVNSNNKVVKEGERGSGCRWDERACTAAVKGGHLDVLVWLRSASPPCPWKEAELCNIAAAVGSLQMLQYLRANGCPWSDEATRVAAQHGHLSVLEFMVMPSSSPNHGPLPFSEQVCASAAFEGHLHILQFARSAAVPAKAYWDEMTCAWAAQAGRLEVLKWMRGAPPTTARADTADTAWPATASQEEGASASTAVLSREERCPWDQKTTYTAAAMGHLEVLKFARSTGNGEKPCPWIAEAVNAAKERGHNNVVKWICSQDPSLVI